ncbi:hypothetical protein [Paractinoplanes globisporus]|uniref:Uncharacterized protein n=1 Tax=Paractinoplanes globisporus TaxID=113565 RepID=A0ABW6WAD2_9ACTN|nr:hypothetical protein [Actinoplanes globisporus]
MTTISAIGDAATTRVQTDDQDLKALAAHHAAKGGHGHHGVKKSGPPPAAAGALSPATKGENSGLADKLDQVSQALDMDSDDVTAQATTASALVGMFRNKGVDPRDVLDSGDLLDVAA